jgi:hypothetical protein
VTSDSSDPPAHPAAEAFGDEPLRAHWSWGHRIFVFALTLGLCCAVFVLVIIEKVESVAPLCVPSSPPVARLPAGQLLELRSELAGVMARADGRVYASGPVPPSAVWTDDPPEGSSLGLSKDRTGPASYELRQWAPDPRFGPAYRDDIAGEVFMFSTPSEAQSFFARAASAKCHRSAVTRRASRPVRARNMIWVNPDAATEEDVYLIDGRRVYRLVDVRPSGGGNPRWSNAQQVGVLTVNRLACTIIGADCPQLSATARFVETAGSAVCAFSGELVSEYRQQAPWALFPVRRRTQAIVASAIQRLRAITPPASKAAAYSAFTDALEQLLALGRRWNASEAAGRPALAREYFGRSPRYQNEYAHLGSALGIYECSPIRARRPTA